MIEHLGQFNKEVKIVVVCDVLYPIPPLFSIFRDI